MNCGVNNLLDIALDIPYFQVQLGHSQRQGHKNTPNCIIMLFFIPGTDTNQGIAAKACVKSSLYPIIT